VKPPLVSGAKVIKALKRAGYRVTGQRGSHVKLYREADESTVIVPFIPRSTVGRSKAS